MAMQIADTATIDPRAELADEVEIGPYCVIGPDVRIGKGTRLLGHVCILGHTTLGQSNTISPFAVLGGDPPDFERRVGASRVEIGENNIIREGVTIHRAACGVTRIGNHNVLMAHVHIAHECQIDDHITLSNGALLGSHVHVEPEATLAPGVVVHNHVTLGQGCFVGSMSRIFHDVPRFMLVDGNPSKVRCIHIVGLKRRALTKPAIEALHEAHRLIYRAKLDLEQAAEALAAHGQLTAEVQSLLDFLASQRQGKHGRARERNGSASAQGPQVELNGLHQGDPG